MHEFSLIQGVLDTVFETAEANGLSCITGVKLRIGGMRQVVPETMRFAFRSAVKGSIAESSGLDMEFLPVVCVCSNCGKETEVEDNVFLCPECHCPDMDIKQGMELIIDSIEGE